VGDAKFFASLTRRHRKVKTLRKQCGVVILTLILAVSAYAGQIQGPGAVGGTTTLLVDGILTIITVIP
jgi:hypothetical protein